MPDIVQSAPACQIVDTAAKLTEVVIAQVAGAGYRGIARYVPLPGNSAKADIDAVELRAILDAGLALLLVQHVRRPGWNPGKCSGENDALAGIKAAREAGYLEGAHIFIDLEGVEGSAVATRAFAEEWAATVVQAGYRAGCYVGYGVPLSASQLYDLHSIDSYWSDAGPRTVATRGFAIKQRQPGIRIGGVGFDVDVVQPDRLGDTPSWMIATVLQISA